MLNKNEKKEEKSLLEELCRDDSELYYFLRQYLYLNPLVGISKNDLGILTEEAGKSGNFRPALDKAIFEGTQNPGERERYIKVIQNLALKAIHAMEQEKEKVEKAGFSDQAASLERRIQNHKFMSERTEDIINVASNFYNEQLLAMREDTGREARAEERKEAEREEQRIMWLERAERETRKKERGKMGREEKMEAEKQDKREELAAGDRKKARAEERKEAEREEERIMELGRTEREARKKERRGN